MSRTCDLELGEAAAPVRRRVKHVLIGGVLRRFTRSGYKSTDRLALGRFGGFELDQTIDKDMWLGSS